MGKVIFKSNRTNFFHKNDSFKEMLMAHMSQDIEVSIKTTAGTPVKTGGMKAEVRHFKSSMGSYRVEAGKDYSAAQELGVINGHPIRRYTTAGTSKGWFKRAIDGVVRNRDQYVAEARRALNL